MKNKIHFGFLVVVPILLILIFLQSPNVSADDVNTSSSVNNSESAVSAESNNNSNSVADNNSNQPNNDDQSNKNDSNNQNHAQKVKKHKYFRAFSKQSTNFNTVVRKNRSLYKNGAYNTNQNNIKSYHNSKILINKWVHVTQFENTQLGKYAHIIHNGKDEGWINNSALDYSSFKLNNVPLIHQRPQLPTGCEITAVTMMINYATGKKYTKTYMANQMPRSTNPNKGFVGSPYSKKGWYVYPPALMKLVHKYVGSSINLTGKSTGYLKLYLKNHQHPIVIWVANVDGFPNHAITITGFTKNKLFYNDPWTGKKTNMDINKINIHRSHDDKRAISY
ncbi:C39 family peptidase [Apilactobacillus quenuiae]|uniref:C39 family peptidase n=1 Tax=Apilactobacillus quenuiae TaxID=2008377 RepID=UPI000D020437|nr:C39 family peptidase [Apilactobacillus quenuiae]